MLRLILAASLASLAGCSAIDPYAEAKEAVSRDLKDPSSAQFRDLKKCEDGKGVIGEVNAKNSYGAYSGFKGFVAIDYRTAIESDDDYRNFHELLRLCRPSLKLTAYDDIEPDNLEALADNSSEPEPEPEPQKRAFGAKPDTVERAPAVSDEGLDDVPVCDRPDSASKSALMNEIGVDCSPH